MSFPLSRFCVRLCLVALAGYLIVLVLLTIYQRTMMYLPSRTSGTAQSYGLATAEDLSLRTPDGETIAAWYQPPRDGKELFLVFHGNGGALSTLSGFLGHLAADGSGFLAIDYRGYGGSTGTPTERGLLLDGETAFLEARKRGFSQDRIIILGESLGTGVAIAVAKAHPPRALVLDSAFSSSTDIAARRYWMFPVRLLMMDRFDSVSRIEGVIVPKLFLHGEQDPAISVDFARKLFERAKEPKTFILVPDGGHLVLWRQDVLAKMRVWLADLPKSGS